MRREALRELCWLQGTVAQRPPLVWYLSSLWACLQPLAVQNYLFLKVGGGTGVKTAFPSCRKSPELAAGSSHGCIIP